MLILFIYVCLALSLMLLTLQAKLKKIHKGIATKLVKDKSQLRAYSVYTDLSGLTKNKSIHHYHLRIAQLAKTLGMCEPTFKKWVNELIKLKWAWLEKGDLRLLGRRKFAKLFPECAQKQYDTIKTTNFKNIELHLRGLAIEENRQKQEYALNKRITDCEVKAADIKCEKMKEQYAKSVNVHRIKSTLRAVNILTKINKEITLSRQGLARTYNLKNKKSGTYWAKILRLAGIIKDETQPLVYLGRMCKGYFYELQLKSKRYLFWNNGKVFCRLPNYLSYQTGVTVT